VKVVFDTNILVSALVFPGGRGEAALVRILQEQDSLLLSKAILDELLGVLARKFSRDAEELARIAVFLADLATTVQPRQTLKIMKDDPDNRILECAVAGHADVIVTGDRALLDLQAFRGVRVVSLHDYLAGGQDQP
jgi:putative PIN family toxin of toxin-antitoxin system